MSACALASCVAIAQAEEVSRLETVDVIGHYDNRVGSTDAASAGVITPQLIDDRPLLRPGEVLEYIPGMIVTQHSGAGKANQYFLRGFNLDHGTDFATYLAGMPVNMRTHAHGQGYTDLNFLIAPRPWLLLDLDVAWTRARFTDDDPVGDHVPDALQWTAQAGVTVQNLGPWTAALWGR